MELKPSYIEHRERLWTKHNDERLSSLESAEKKTITIKALNKNDEKVSKEGLSWSTSPWQIAQQILPKAFCDEIIVAKVNGVLWDLERVLEEDCEIEFLRFDNEEAQAVFWHSTAHVLGEAIERFYGGHLCYGPPISEGFYYDVFMTNESGNESRNVVLPQHYAQLETVMKKICSEKQPFGRLELTKEQLKEMFHYNQFKLRILDNKVIEPKTTAYKCGTLIDLCRGPHVRHTGLLKAFKVAKHSCSYWEGKNDAESLQRIYGISFPNNKQLQEYIKIQEEAAKYDHRRIGVEQNLFFFDELSPGSCFFTGKGTHIYNTLVKFLKEQYRERGIEEVKTPNIFKSNLYKISGHLDHYADNMYSIDIEKEKFCLKPMNCPAHCLIYKSEVRSWRDLPIRWADFGALHRNEASGALSGLTRVRRFQQDDAHIFCTKDQIESEVAYTINFIEHVYKQFGFTCEYCLSTRPESYLGELAIWDQAEDALRHALNGTGQKYKIKDGDGAFYGPKIDITLRDALRRPHQCATIQLDFQLPVRFELSYVSADGSHQRPVMVHRAILGSVERFMAIVIENFKGNLPFWLSPRQAQIVSVATAFDDYARTVKDELHRAGFEVALELDPGKTLDKKVKMAWEHHFKFLLFVGEKESKTSSVSVRTVVANRRFTEVPIEKLIATFAKFKKDRISDEVMVELLDELNE